MGNVDARFDKKRECMEFQKVLFDNVKVIMFNGWRALYKVNQHLSKKSTHLNTHHIPIFT